MAAIAAFIDIYNNKGIYQAHSFSVGYFKRSSVQLCAPTVLVLFAYTWLLCLPVMYSLWLQNRWFNRTECLAGDGKCLYGDAFPNIYQSKNAQSIQLLTFNIQGFTYYVPEHERPSPVCPSLHVQLCPPTVLLQFAFTSQSWFPVMHSSTSG